MWPGWILELDRGRGIPYEGNYTGWLEQKRKRLEQEEREDKSRQRTLASEQEWISQSPRARQAKQKARITAYEELLAQAAERAPGSAQIIIPAGPRLGDLVIEATDVKKAFGDRLLIDDLSFRLPPGGIVGVIGPNGAGKTTLFRMIIGEENAGHRQLPPRRHGQARLCRPEPRQPQARQERLGGDQRGQGADRARQIQHEQPGLRLRVQLPRARPAEKSRHALGRRAQPGASGEAAEVRRQRHPPGRAHQRPRRRHAPGPRGGAPGFAGCAVVISHDRWFLDRIATHILSFEGDSQVVWFEGNYQDYEADRHRRLGTAADQPHRIKYKPLKAA